MLVLKKRKLFLKLEEVYYAQDHATYKTNADIVLFYQCVKSQEVCHNKNTLHIDLSKDEEALFSDLHEHTRRELMRARNDSNKYIFNENPTMEQFIEFCDFYNVFASTKGITSIDPVSYKLLLENNSFIITKMLDNEDKVLCYHTYIVDGHRARTQHSCSQFRNSEDKNYRALVGRANRELHWKDMMTFKEKEFSIYDFGGLALNDDPVMKNIDKFKMSFGGKIVTEYEFYQPRSFLGKLMLKITKKDVS
ncbi:MAG: hypothetical protein Q8942_01255 [Bacillota bacterium]|nr:hypothetical protein [Bacillota bacterium]